jgi:predicted O-linked N-acetylglucosamine transferase (SPINDLY family)
MALHQAGQIDDAERLYRELLTHTPEHATARHYLGVCHYQRGQLPEAAIEISRALRSNPAEPMALNNLGLVYKAQGDNAAAGQCFTHAIEQDPHSAVALTNRGLLLLESGRTEEAIRDCAAAAEYAPTLAETHNNLAKALVAVRRIVEAEAAWARAVAANPDLAEAHFNRAEVLVELRRFEAAIESYRCAEALNPAMPWLAGGLMHAQMHACDWADFASHEAKILAAVDRGDKAIKPLPLIALRSTMAQQQRCARAIISEKFAGHHRRPVIANHRHDRLRIAYLSADFRTHPTSQLIAGLIEHHDRARFEVLGVYVGPPQQDEWRARMERAFDRFFDFHGNSDEAIATALRSLEIDILIDLMGHTHMARHGVLAARIAPVQVNYLGYPVRRLHHCRPGVDRAGRSRLLRRKDRHAAAHLSAQRRQAGAARRPWQSDGPRPAGRGLRLLLFQQFVQDHAGRIRHLDATVTANRMQRALAAAADRSG